MKQKPLFIILWLIVFPVLSLLASAFLLMLAEKDLSRSLYVLLQTVVGVLPVHVLSVGIQRVFRLTTPLHLLIGAVVSALLWAVTAFVMWHLVPGNDQDLSYGSIVGTFIILGFASWLMQMLYNRVMRHKKPPKAVA